MGHGSGKKTRQRSDVCFAPMLSRAGLAIGLSLLVACSQARREPAAAGVPKPRSGQPLLPAQFHLTAVAASDGSRRYLASTDDAGASCRFEIEQKVSGGEPISLANVVLRRQAGSDCTAFLRRVARELEFTGRLPRAVPAEELVGSVAILGTNQSRSGDPATGVRFSSIPPGNWMAAKLFLADGEGEVFLNVSERDGLGEFSIKDADYAVIVVTELGKILLPRAGGT
jgi:hypothetical protein